MPILTLDKTEEEIKNEQSRDTGNIGHTNDKMKTNKTKNTTHIAKQMSNTDLYE